MSDAAPKLHGSRGHTTCWITGAAGFLGQAVLRHLTDHHQAVGIGCLGRGVSQTPCHAASDGAVSDTTLADLVRQTGVPTHVFHLAAGASVGQSLQAPRVDFQKTVDSASILFGWLGRNAPDAKVLLASSAAVYGPGRAGPIPETAPRNPASPYGWHKKMVEDLAACEAQTSGLRVLPVRIFSLFGAGLKKQLFWDLAQKWRDDPQHIALMGTGAELRDWCHVDEAARVLVQLAFSQTAFDSPLNPVNLASGRGVTVGEAARTFVSDLRGSAPPKPVLRFSGLRPPGDPPALVGCTARLKALGLTPPRAFPHGLRATAQSYRRDIHDIRDRLHPAARGPLAWRAGLPAHADFGLSGGTDPP